MVGCFGSLAVGPGTSVAHIRYFDSMHRSDLAVTNWDTLRQVGQLISYRCLSLGCAAGMGQCSSSFQIQLQPILQMYQLNPNPIISIHLTFNLSFMIYKLLGYCYFIYILINIITIIIMNLNTNSSYFSRHKNALNQQKSRTSKVSNNNSSNKSMNNIQQIEKNIQQKVIQKQKSSQGSFIDLSYVQDKTQEQKIYEEYKQIKKNYQQELSLILLEIDKLKREAEAENKKVKQAESTLQSKKKQLKLTKQRYEQMLATYKKQQVEEVSQGKVAKLQQQLAQITERNVKKIKQLNQQQQKLKQENQKLQQKLKMVEQQYEKALQFNHTQYEQQKKQLQEEEEQLKKQLDSLEKDTQKVKQDIQKIQDMKPVSGDVHKKYLDLFQKMFISQQLAKAEKIMGLKQQERKQNIQFARRKQWLKQKQKQIQQRQSRISQKNALIDKLTNQIRQKSTWLLTKFSADSQKHRR